MYVPSRAAIPHAAGKMKAPGRKTEGMMHAMPQSWMESEVW